MRTDRLQKLAAHLRDPKTAEHFDLGFYFLTQSRRVDALSARDAIHSCGTVACIAGHAVVLADPFARVVGNVHVQATIWLGLDNHRAAELFTPDEEFVDYDLVTNIVAAEVVEVLAETGEVIWPERVRPVL